MSRELGTFVTRAAATQAHGEFLQRGFPGNLWVFMCSSRSKSGSAASPAAVAVGCCGAAVVQRAQTPLIYGLTGCECASSQVMKVPRPHVTSTSFEPCGFALRGRGQA